LQYVQAAMYTVTRVQNDTHTALAAKNEAVPLESKGTVTKL